MKRDLTFLKKFFSKLIRNDLFLISLFRYIFEKVKKVQKESILALFTSKFISFSELKFKKVKTIRKLAKRFVFGESPKIT